jgi:hypothetical protein
VLKIPGVGELMLASFPKSNFVKQISPSNFWYFFYYYYLLLSYLFASLLEGGWEKNMMVFAFVGILAID